MTVYADVHDPHDTNPWTADHDADYGDEPPTPEELAAYHPTDGEDDYR